jgi:hypothetical protein
MSLRPLSIYHLHDTLDHHERSFTDRIRGQVLPKAEVVFKMAGSASLREMTLDHC